MPLFVERALFIVAPQDSGKSTALRSMFADPRLGTRGVVPKSKDKLRLPADYRLSRERRLYLPLTSLHEYGETLREFVDKTRGSMDSGRWCYAGPFQPDAYKNMPDVVDCVAAFVEAFEPERVRVAFLSPNRHGQCVDTVLPGRDLSHELLSIESVEVMFLDGRRRGKNGLVLADFFDFT